MRLASLPALARVAVLSLTAAALLGAAPAARADAQLDPAKVKRIKQATVLLKVQLPDGRTVQGSGFFAFAPGLVVTNAHVLGMLDPDSRKPVRVEAVVGAGEPGSKTVPARVLGVDRGTDLGALRVEGRGLPAPLPLGTAAGLTETQEVFIFGFPLADRVGQNITVSRSSVSSLRKSGTAIQRVQVNGGMHPGNSGGPVTDARGQVVGVAVSAIQGTQLHFAVPAERVTTFLNGRINSMVTDTPYVDGPRVRLPVTVDMIDPLGRVRQVAVEVWSGPQGPPRPVSNSAPQPRQGDSPHQTTKLKYDPAAATAKGEVTLPKLADAKQVYYLRPVVTDGSGRTRWMGTSGRRFAPAVTRAPATLRFRAGARQNVELQSQTSFRLRLPGGEEISQGMNLRAGLLERAVGAGPGDTTRLRLDYTRFSVTVLEDNKPVPASEKFKRFASDVRFLGAEVELDPEGALVRGKADLSRVPAGSRGALDDVSDQVLQSLEVLSVPLPNGEAKPGQTWKAQRHLLVGSLGLAVPALADVRYTYLGTQPFEGKTTALVRLSGTLRGLRGNGLNVGGSLTGTANIDPATGQVLRCSASVKADVDVELRRQQAKAAGTLAVSLKRAPAAPK